MKKQYFCGIVLLLCLLVLSISCTEEKTENANSETTSQVQATKPVTAPAVILYDTAAKWQENENGDMEYKQSSESGEVVEVFMIPDSANPELLVPEKKEAVRTSDDARREFYHILVDEEEEFWIQDVFLGIDTVPGIILEDNAFLYREADIAAIYSDARKIPQYFTLAVHPKESNTEFACVSAYVYDFNSPSIVKQFIKREMVTTDSLDLQVLKLYQIAESNENETVKREILNDALPMGSKFNHLVVEALNKLSSEPITFTIEPFINSEELKYYTHDDENGTINVRNKPGVVGSEVLFTVSSELEVVVIARTNETEMIDGYEGSWLQVRIPSMENQEGWIFGKYVIR